MLLTYKWDSNLAVTPYSKQNHTDCKPHPSQPQSSFYTAATGHPIRHPRPPSSPSASQPPPTTSLLSRLPRIPRRSRYTYHSRYLRPATLHRSLSKLHTLTAHLPFPLRYATAAHLLPHPRQPSTSALHFISSALHCPHDHICHLAEPTVPPRRRRLATAHRSMFPLRNRTRLLVGPLLVPRLHHRRNLPPVAPTPMTRLNTLMKVSVIPSPYIIHRTRDAVAAGPSSSANSGELAIEFLENELCLISAQRKDLVNRELQVWSLLLKLKGFGTIGSVDRPPVANNAASESTGSSSDESPNS
nr:uncharacterized protein LOC109173926 [Ipomoea batatas]